MGHTVIRQRKDGSGFTLLVIALAMGTLLVGCSSTSSNSARVVDRNNTVPKRPAVTTGQYIVKPGDTLFSIAFRYGWDYKELAARNGIAAPYTIRPGKRFVSAAALPAAPRWCPARRRRARPRSSGGLWEAPAHLLATPANRPRRQPPAAPRWSPRCLPRSVR